MKAMALLIVVFVGLAAWTAAAVETYSPDAHPEVALIYAHLPEAAQVTDALKDSGDNWPELAAALQQATTPTELEDSVWLITRMSRLDRLEMTAANLFEHVRGARRIADLVPYEVLGPLWTDYLLNYRIADEPCEPWRNRLQVRFLPLVAHTPRETARRINVWVARHLTIVKRSGYGVQPPPLAVFASGVGTEGDAAVLTVAILRSLGIPARRVRCPVLREQEGGVEWVEFHAEGEWMPLYPLYPRGFADPTFLGRLLRGRITAIYAQEGFGTIQVTERYGPVGHLGLRFVRGETREPSFQHFSIAVLSDGFWQALDDLGSASSSLPSLPDCDFTAHLAPGAYLVQAGIREPDGSVSVFLQPVDLQAGEERILTINLEHPQG